MPALPRGYSAGHTHIDWLIGVFVDLQELAGDVEQLGAALLLDEDLEATASRIADVAATVVDGADASGLSLVTKDGIKSFGATEDVVYAVDRLQYKYREGPCMAALVRPGMYRVDDLTTTESWPNFSPAAANKGVRSMLAFVLQIGDTFGALNLYAKRPAAFSAHDEEVGAILAAFASAILTRTHQLELEQNHVRRLERALDSRTVIGVAIGILMEREGRTEEEAFDLLRRASQNLNVKVREIAGRIVTQTSADHSSDRAAERT